MNAKGYLVTATGKRVMIIHANGNQQSQYHIPDGSWDSFSSEYWLVRIKNIGPPIRAGGGLRGVATQMLQRTIKVAAITNVTADEAVLK